VISYFLSKMLLLVVLISYDAMVNHHAFAASRAIKVVQASERG